MNTLSNATATLGTGEQADGLSAALFESARAGVVAVDGDGVVIAFTSVAEQIFGMRAADVMSQSAAVLGGDFNRLIQDSIRQAEAISRDDVKITHHKPSLVSVKTTIGTAPDGAVRCVVAEVQETATAAGIAANLEQLDRLAGLGVVTAGVAHELKNALVAVRTFFDLLAAGENDPELHKVAAGEAQRIEQTIRQLLRGARRDEPRMAGVSVHTLLHDSLNLVRHELQARGVVVRSVLEAEEDRVLGDERQLRHIMVNLLVNAAEAMPGGGEVLVKTDNVEAWERRHLRITVSDNGTGMSSEDLTRLFRPFYTTKREGTGLGLAISRQIVNAHNGVIRVESELGKGTTFSIYLPLN